jgi:hypothetical protein
MFFLNWRGTDCSGAQSRKRVFGKPGQRDEPRPDIGFCANTRLLKDGHNSSLKNLGGAESSPARYNCTMCQLLQLCHIKGDTGRDAVRLLFLG